MCVVVKTKIETRLIIGGTVFLFVAAILVMMLIGNVVDVDHINRTRDDLQKSVLEGVREKVRERK